MHSINPQSVCGLERSNLLSPKAAVARTFVPVDKHKHKHVDLFSLCKNTRGFPSHLVSYS